MPTMKIKLGIILMIILFVPLNFCSKEVPATSPVNNIFGKWKWRYTIPEIHSPYDDPLTPENTGMQELLIYNSDFTWQQYQNDQLKDSGTFKTGHGSHAQWAGGYIYQYDSIVYYKNGILSSKPFDIYSIIGETLQFCICKEGRIINEPYPGGQREYIKQP